MSLTEKLLLKSFDRASGTSANFKVNTLRPLSGAYEVLFLQIPNTLLNVSALNNTIYYNYNGGGSASTTIASGNYSASTLATALNTAMVAVDAGFTVTYSSITSKLTFTHSTNPFVLEWSNTSASLANTLGFADSDTASATSAVASTVVNLSRFTMGVVINIEESASNIWSTDTTSSNRGSIVVPFTGDYGVYQVLKNTDLNQHIEFLAPTSKLTIKIYDYDGNTVDMGNVDWTMMLQKL